MDLIDAYPAMLVDVRTWSVLALLVLWGMQGVLCGILAQAFTKRLLAAVYEGE